MVEHIEEPFEVTIRDGNAICVWRDGRKIVQSVRVFRIEVERARQALVDYDARQAQIINFRARGGHAAS